MQESLPIYSPPSRSPLLGFAPRMADRWAPYKYRSGERKIVDSSPPSIFSGQGLQIKVRFRHSTSTRTGTTAKSVYTAACPERSRRNDTTYLCAEHSGETLESIPSSTRRRPRLEPIRRYNRASALGSLEASWIRTSVVVGKGRKDTPVTLGQRRIGDSASVRQGTRSRSLSCRFCCHRRDGSLSLPSFKFVPTYTIGTHRRLCIGLHSPSLFTPAAPSPMRELP